MKALNGFCHEWTVEQLKFNKKFNNLHLRIFIFLHLITYNRYNDARPTKWAKLFKDCN